MFGKPQGNDRGFQLNLPAQVSGRDASGREFEEDTTVDFMSQAAASFDIKTPVIQGGELKLVVSLPPSSPRTRISSWPSAAGSLTRSDVRPQTGLPKYS